jgi:hypothetical protein
MGDWRCATCGEQHDEPPRDLGFALPDEIFALDEEDRGARAESTPDQCTLDGRRRFVRCVLDLPTPDAIGANGDDRVSLGLWVEVQEQDFGAIIGYAGSEQERGRAYHGLVANEVEGLPGTLGLEVIVRPSEGAQRPTLQVTDEDHLLGIWQKVGIAWDDWMRILAGVSTVWAAHLFAQTCARYELELVAPRSSTCAHCGRPEVFLTRYVSKDERAAAIYYASFTEGHEPKEVSVLLTIGDFDGAADPSTRLAFRLELRSGGSRVGDATDGRWTVPAFFGAPLTRAEALGHPRIDEVFEVMDVALEKDDIIAAYLQEAPS